MEKKPSLKVKANKLTEWLFSIPAVDGNNKNISVEVRLVSDKDGLRMRALTQDNLLAPIEDADVSSLHAKVEAALLALNMGTRIEWQDYLQIEVSGNGVNEAFIDTEYNFQQLDVKIKRVKYGLHPDNHEPYILDRQGYPTKVKQNKTFMFQGKPYDPDQGTQFSYIPATPENIAAMDDVCARMRVLKDRLSDVLSQDNVQLTLSDLAARLPLLENKSVA